MSVFYLLNLVSTLAVFCAAAWRLMLTVHSRTGVAHRASWLLQGGALIGVAVGVLGIFLRDLTRHDYAAPWYVLVLRLGLIVLLVHPWQQETNR